MKEEDSVAELIQIQGEAGIFTILMERFDFEKDLPEDLREALTNAGVSFEDLYEATKKDSLSPSIADMLIYECELPEHIKETATNTKAAMKHYENLVHKYRQIYDIWW